MRLLRIVGALALALTLAAPAYAAPICGGLTHKIQPRPAYDPGGDLDDYIAFVTKRRPHPLRMEIHECYSACAMKLSAKDVCIARNAIIGIHEARHVKNMCDPYGYDHGARDEAGTAIYRSHMPACAQRLFDSRNAFASNRITKFTGQEVLDACPQIKACK